MQIKVIFIKSTGKKQAAEVISTVIKIYNKVSVSDINKTILQPKPHKLEKLRGQAHLRLRTNIFGSIMRIRAINYLFMCMSIFILMVFSTCIHLLLLL